MSSPLYDACFSTDVTGADLLLSLRSAEVTAVFPPPRAGSCLGEMHSPRAPMRVGQAEHQILYARQAPAKRFHAPPLKPGSPERPSRTNGLRVAR
jgi:hypothetical protein